MTRIVATVRHRLRRDSERGAVSVYAVIIAAVLMLMAGLCIEGGRVLNARATLADQAEQAARAGAQHLSTDDVRGGATVSVDSAAATSAARRSLAAADTANARCSGGVDVGGFGRGGTVTATVSCRVELSDLGLVFLPGATTVTASSTAPVDTWRGTR